MSTNDNSNDQKTKLLSAFPIISGSSSSAGASASASKPPPKLFLQPPHSDDEDEEEDDNEEENSLTLTSSNTLNFFRPVLKTQSATSEEETMAKGKEEGKGVGKRGQSGKEREGVGPRGKESDKEIEKVDDDEEEEEEEEEEDDDDDDDEASYKMTRKIGKGEEGGEAEEAEEAAATMDSLSLLDAKKKQGSSDLGNSHISSASSSSSSSSSSSKHIPRSGMSPTSTHHPHGHTHSHHHHHSSSKHDRQPSTDSTSSGSSASSSSSALVGQTHPIPSRGSQNSLSLSRSGSLHQHLHLHDGSRQSTSSPVPSHGHIGALSRVAMTDMRRTRNISLDDEQVLLRTQSSVDSDFDAVLVDSSPSSPHTSTQNLLVPPVVAAGRRRRAASDVSISSARASIAEFESTEGLTPESPSGSGAHTPEISVSSASTNPFNFSAQNSQQSTAHSRHQNSGQHQHHHQNLLHMLHHTHSSSKGHGNIPEVDPALSAAVAAAAAAAGKKSPEPSKVGPIAGSKVNNNANSSKNNSNNFNIGKQPQTAASAASTTGPSKLSNILSAMSPVKIFKAPAGAGSSNNAPSALPRLRPALPRNQSIAPTITGVDLANKMRAISKWADVNSIEFELASRPSYLRSEETAREAWPPEGNFFSLPLAKMKNACRHGIPYEHRYWVWPRLCGISQSDMAKIKSRYEDALRSTFSLKKDAELDKFQVPPSTPIPLFGGRINEQHLHLTTEGIRRLHRILCCIAYQRPDVEFCPMLPSIAAIFLHYMTEVEVHACMITLLNSKKYEYFFTSPKKFAKACMGFSVLVSRYLNSFYKYVTALDPEKAKQTVLFNGWMSWIVDLLSFPCLSVVIDSFLLEGPKIMFRVGLAILGAAEKFAFDEHSLSGIVKAVTDTAKQYHNPGRLMRMAFRPSLSRKFITEACEKSKDILVNLPTTDAARELFTRPKPLLDKSSKILTGRELEELWTWIPLRFRIRNLRNLFSTETNGYSLKTFYNLVEDYHPTIMLIRTVQNQVFGAFLTHHWSERRQERNFFGNGECFVFSLRPAFKKYNWVGMGGSPNALEYFMMGTEKTLIIGGGGEGNAIWIDEELNKGVTSKCATFDNEPLTGSGVDFQCAEMEVFCFDEDFE